MAAVPIEMPDRRPEDEPIAATEALPELHIPPPLVLLSVAVPPKQTDEAPSMGLAKKDEMIFVA
jgi:hypothetical protein